VLGAARGPFAVILAFVIFIAFQGFNDARHYADQEASATRRLKFNAISERLANIEAQPKVLSDEAMEAVGRI
jgi:hypothetical protein